MNKHFHINQTDESNYHMTRYITNNINNKNIKYNNCDDTTNLNHKSVVSNITRKIDQLHKYETFNHFTTQNKKNTSNLCLFNDNVINDNTKVIKNQNCIENTENSVLTKNVFFI